MKSLIARLHSSQHVFRLGSNHDISSSVYSQEKPGVDSNFAICFFVTLSIVIVSILTEFRHFQLASCIHNSAITVSASSTIAHLSSHTATRVVSNNSPDSPSISFLSPKGRSDSGGTDASDYRGTASAAPIGLVPRLVLPCLLPPLPPFPPSAKVPVPQSEVRGCMPSRSAAFDLRPPSIDSGAQSPDTLRAPCCSPGI